MEKKDLELWTTELRVRTVGRGLVGDVEWYVAAMSPLPGLNAYLYLPEGHPWVGHPEDECTEAAPTYAGFSKDRWVGCHGLDNAGRWEIPDLRANVDPFPEEWEWVLEASSKAGIEWPVGGGPWPWDRLWTVASWTLATLNWAKAANRVLSPEMNEREDRRGGND